VNVRNQGIDEELLYLFLFPIWRVSLWMRSDFIRLPARARAVAAAGAALVEERVLAARSLAGLRLWLVRAGTACFGLLASESSAGASSRFTF